LPYRPQLYPQWPLLPQRKGLLVEPIPRLRIKFKIEIEEYPGQNESHLDIREVLANAVPRANRERLQYISVIVDECRIAIFEETFGGE
jgi:hypothetical protein